MGLSTHVLDANNGQPAVGVAVSLASHKNDQSWAVIARSLTDAEGRVPDLDAGQLLEAGTYRITFDTGAYYAATGTATFYPEVTVVFEIADPLRHHHVPLLLSPFAYSTYRGS